MEILITRLQLTGNFLSLTVDFVIRSFSVIDQFLFDILVCYVIITVVNFPSNINGAKKAYEEIY